MEGFSGAGALELEGNYNLYWDSERGCGLMSVRPLTAMWSSGLSDC